MIEKNGCHFWIQQNKMVLIQLRKHKQLIFLSCNPDYMNMEKEKGC